MINTIKDINSRFELFPSVENFSAIYTHTLEDVCVLGKTLYYPNVILYSKIDDKFYDPLEESTMSLRSVNKTETLDLNIPTTNTICDDPVFYYVYNNENYYHFVYDTLPYLISFFKLKQTIKNLKLLVYYSNNNSFYKFFTEFLNILNINESDLVILNSSTLYKKVYISSSYTYGKDPKQAPHNEIYELYNDIINNVISTNDKSKFPKKFYISRRSWIHNDFSNIGTNYTTRRVCTNENELVNLLNNNGYEEIFTENLSVIDKILLFNNAESIIGATGGGLVNVLFSKPTCKLITLVSPTFLDVNYRFIYSLNKVNTYYFNKTTHVESTEFKRYMRVQSGNIIGEIEDIVNDDLIIKYSDRKVVGWNQEIKYNLIKLNKKDCHKLDNGLNSSWIVDLQSLKEIII